MTHPSPSGFGFAFFAVLIWGTQLPIAKGAMLDLDGYTITLARYGLAVVGMLPILLWREGRAALRFDGHGRLIWAAGVIGMAGSGLLVFTGLSMTRPEVTVIIIALQPALTAIAQWLFKGRRPAWITLCCLVAAFLGVAFVVTRGGTGLPELMRSSANELIGNALVLLGSAAWVGYALMVEKLRGWSSLRISTLSCLTALPAILIVWGLLQAIGLAMMPTGAQLIEHSWRLGYLGIPGILIAMLLWNAGTQRIGPLNAMLMINLMPVFTFAMRALEGATIRSSELIGAAIVVGALVTNNAYLRIAARRADRRHKLAGLPQTQA
ncbi:MAG: DMT family transporter [Quisquiliibacterium sp.]